MGLTINLDVDVGMRTLRSTSVEVRKATTRALNRTAGNAKTAANKTIRSVGYNMKAGDINKALRVDRATDGKLSVTLSASSRPLPLSYFNPTGGGTPHHRLPIRVRILRTTQTLKHAFFLPNSGKNVFTRRDPKSGSISRRLPIQKMYGPSITDAFKNEQVQTAVVARIREQFAKNIAHEMEYVVANR